MSVIQWNLRGINSNRDELKNFVKVHGSEIILLQETKLKGRDTVGIAGFKTFCRNARCERNQIAHGGVAILVKECLNPTRIPLDTRLQAIAVEVELRSPTVFCSLYMQENDRVSKRELDELIDQLGERFIIGGDFNAHNPLWHHEDYNSLGMIVEEIMIEKDLILLNSEEATYLNKRNKKWSILDLTISNRDEWGDCKWKPLEDLANSDHLPIVFETLPRTNLELTCDLKYQENKADWNEFRKRSSRIVLSQIDQRSLTIFNKQILNIADRTIPKNSGKPRRRAVPWWTEEIKEAVKTRKRALRRFKQNLTDNNLIFLNQATARCKRLIKVGKRKATEDICNSISGSTPAAKVFSNVKRIQGLSSPRIIKMLKVDDRTITDAGTIANVLANHFSKNSSDRVYSASFRCEKYLVESKALNIPEVNDPINSPFSTSELNHALQKCSGKSTGPNGISYGMLKNLHWKAKMQLLQIFNHIWSHRWYPEEWKHALTIPLQKPGKSAFDPDGKRPISLTCTDSKLFERMAMRRLNWWLEENQKLDQAQNGFRQGRSCTDNAIILHKVLVQELHEGKHSFCIFFDLQKAYDRVWRHSVIRKLLEWGLGGNLVHFLQGFLRNRTMQVKCNGTVSEIVSLENGVPQGTVAAVTCFLISIVDFERDVKREFLRRFPHLRLVLLSYADDKAGIITGPTNDQTMRDAIQFLATFTDSWMKKRGLSLSPPKTQILHVCNKKGCRKVKISIDEHEITQSRIVKFLGHTFDSRLLFNQHIRQIKSKCVRPLAAVRFLSKPSMNADTRTLIQIVHSMITSKLLFGSEVYFGAAESNLKHLRSIYVAGLRYAIGAFRTSPLDSIVFESGQISFHTQVRRRNLTCALRALSLEHLLEYDLHEPIGHTRLLTLGDFFQECRQELNIELSSVIRTGQGAPPWKFDKLRIDTELARTEKGSVPPQILRRMANNKINSKRQGNLIFTDASHGDNGTAYAVVFENETVTGKMQPITSVFTAELTAIYRAVQMSSEIQGKTTIVTDSLSALRALENHNNKDPLVKMVQRLSCQMSGRVEFLFVHSHVGVVGNEKADEAAKNCVESQLITDNLMTVNNSKRAISIKVKQWRREEWDSIAPTNKLKSHVNYFTTRDPYQMRDRRDRVVISRMRIGHTCLTHLYLLSSPHTQPLCPHCQTLMTVDHLLLECTGVLSQRQIAGIQGTLKDIFEPSVRGSKILIEFLKNVNLYHKI